MNLFIVLLLFTTKITVYIYPFFVYANEIKKFAKNPLTYIEDVLTDPQTWVKYLVFLVSFFVSMTESKENLALKRRVAELRDLLGEAVPQRAIERLAMVLLVEDTCCHCNGPFPVVHDVDLGDGRELSFLPCGCLAHPRCVRRVVRAAGRGNNGTRCPRCRRGRPWVIRANAFIPNNIDNMLGDAPAPPPPLPSVFSWSNFGLFCCMVLVLSMAGSANGCTPAALLQGQRLLPPQSPVWHPPGFGQQAPVQIIASETDFTLLSAPPRTPTNNPAPTKTNEEYKLQRPRSLRAAPALLPQIPEITPECMKYVQQVMPGHVWPTPAAVMTVQRDDKPLTSSETESEASQETKESSNESQSQDNQAFSSGTSTESSSTEDVTQTKQKVHVSQTSEQLAGVKVSRKQYKVELQRQIDERRRREEEIRQREMEEEERIQHKIRIEQEKMQREYEEELRKQHEKEIDAEKKRLATLAKQSELIKADEDNKSAALKAPREKGKFPQLTQRSDTTEGKATVEESSSQESIESIGQFFDTTMKSDEDKCINPDDRIIPVVAKKLRESTLHAKLCSKGLENRNEEMIACPEIQKRGCRESGLGSLTSRVQKSLLDPAECYELPEPPDPSCTREIAIRSAPADSSHSFGFLSNLRNYLKGKKSELDQRIKARSSKSAGEI